MQKIISKIVLIGSIGVGKTSLIRQFVHSKFSDQYLSTIGVKVDKKSIHLDNIEVDLLIWDLAGEIYLSNLFEKYLQGAAGIMGVFDVTRPGTHDKLNEVLGNLTKLNPDLSTILLGNKSDLIEDESLGKHVRENYTYDFMTSAKTGDFVETAFVELAKRIAKIKITLPDGQEK